MQEKEKKQRSFLIIFPAFLHYEGQLHNLHSGMKIGLIYPGVPSIKPLLVIYKCINNDRHLYNFYWSQVRSNFNKAFIHKIYKCKYLFSCRRKTIATLENYTCKSFMEITPWLALQLPSLISFEEKTYNGNFCLFTMIGNM